MLELQQKGFFHHILLKYDEFILVTMPIMLAYIVNFWLSPGDLFSFIIASIFFVVIACRLDAEYLKYHELYHEDIKLSFIPPLYFAKRNKLLSKASSTPGHLISLILGLVIFGFLTTISDSKSMVEKTSCELVTEMIQKNTSQDAYCEKANLEERSDGLYTGTAFMNNGEKVRIIATEESGYVEVRVFDF